MLEPITITVTLKVGVTTPEAAAQVMSAVMNDSSLAMHFVNYITSAGRIDDPVQNRGLSASIEI